MARKKKVKPEDEIIDLLGEPEDVLEFDGEPPTDLRGE